MDGEDGGYYQPSVDDDGNLNWMGSKVGMPAVEAKNIRGPQGPKGDTGETGPQGRAGQDGAAGEDGRGVTYIAYTSVENKWIFGFSDGASQLVSGPAIPAVSASLNSASDSTAASSSAVRLVYNLAATAMQRAGGTFTGTIKAGGSYQSYSTSLLRNSKLVSSDTTPSVNGEINWTYG